jgi:hypothetical protein
MKASGVPQTKTYGGTGASLVTPQRDVDGDSKSALFNALDHYGIRSAEDLKNWYDNRGTYGYNEPGIDLVPYGQLNKSQRAAVGRRIKSKDGSATAEDKAVLRKYERDLGIDDVVVLEMYLPAAPHWDYTDTEGSKQNVRIEQDKAKANFYEGRKNTIENK